MLGMGCDCWAAVQRWRIPHPPVMLPSGKGAIFCQGSCMWGDPVVLRPPPLQAPSPEMQYGNTLCCPCCPYIGICLCIRPSLPCQVLGGECNGQQGQLGQGCGSPTAIARCASRIAHRANACVESEQRNKERSSVLRYFVVLYLLLILCLAFFWLL